MDLALFRLFGDIDFSYSVTLYILSIGMIISSLEDLSVWSIYKTTGLISWNIEKNRSPNLARGFISKVADLFLIDRNFKVVLILKLFCSICLLALTALNIISPILLCTLLFLTALISIRSNYGLDGAYQMYLAILFALSIASLSGLHSQTAIYCLWFIAGELILSYFIAGINKLISPIWRGTNALHAIFSTRSYGHASVYQFVQKSDAISTALSWTVFLFEIAFVLILFTSPMYALIFCCIGFSFHLFNAIFMGLNDFLFAFMAAYPAVLYCVYQISS